jgi:Tfp pilus assembly protein PilN
MKAVNLLPERARPRKATGSQQGSSYVVLGVLGALLVAVALYVLTANSINDSNSKIADAKAETARADAQAASLGAYGDFAKVKKERVASVTSIASQRFDWERAARELATVLPSGMWLTTVSATDGTGQQTAGSGNNSSAPQPPAGGAGLALEGCARDQDTVAVALVRMREMQGAQDVSLDHSTKGEAADSAGGGSSSGGSGDCGSTHGDPNYSFAATVTFGPGADNGDGSNVPNRLGGGQ